MKRLKAVIITTLLFISLNAYALIKVGTVLFKPPFVMSVGKGQESGFDIDFMQTLCQRMAEQCQFTAMRYDKLLKAVRAGTVDLAISGIAISAQSKMQYIFSLPYMVSKAQFLVLANASFQSVSDLHGITVGVVNGEGYANYLKNAYPNQFQVTLYPYILDMLEALSNGNIAATYLDQPTASYWLQHGDGEFKTIGKAEAMGYGYGIMATPNNAALIVRINQQMLLMEQDGTYIKLYTKYFSDFSFSALESKQTRFLS